jgi:predicted phage baseplate assembly protein
MTRTCGCCEGTRRLTPVPIVNPPGLGALRYRAGTHATFLETMKGRLSDLLVVLPGSTEASAPLRGLHARDPGDPAIALLDAWALVADVLTFYQERIANEGYLRTATERRSILELASLVGYRLRPGVAASVFLAFTLEDGYRGEIPAGTRAQSLPVPGELPQPFETGAPLPARAEWNILRPRPTRPQALATTLAAQGTNGASRTVYLDGTQTRLSVNDPLLLDLGDDQQRLLRARAVRPEPAAGRTAVDVEPWLLQRTPGTLGRARLPAAAAMVEAARRVVRAALDLGAHRVLPGATVQRIVDLLLRLGARLEGPASPADLVAVLEGEILPPLRAEHDRAVRLRYTRLQPWLDRFVPELERILEQLVRRQAGADTASTAAPQPGFAGVGALVGDLTKPASIPPSDPSRLPRDLAATYAATGDTLPRLLSALQPALGDVLYAAWEGLPRTEAATEELYALRVRAGLFGHNAPPRAAESFSIGLSGVEAFVLDVTIGANSIRIDVPATDGTSTTPFPAAAETVEVTLSGLTAEAPVLTVVFKRRRVVVEIRAGGRGPIQVSSAGSDPTVVAFGTGPIEIVTGPAQPTLVVSGEIQAEFPLVEQPSVVSLDASYPQILPGSWVALEKPDGQAGSTLLVRRVLTVRETSRADYGVTATGTQLLLESDWLDPADTFATVRGTTVYAQSERLDLAEVPIDPVDEPICGDRIELDGLYDGLEPGRRLIVAGERTDVPAVTGVSAAELVMLAGVEQLVQPELPGETTHTTLGLASKLAYCYRRDTVTVYGNVADASHGESRTQVLGSGDASRAGQRFELRQAPLTYVAATTPSGTESTLRARVNDILWHELPRLAEAGPDDRSYATVTDADQKTTVLFGDGRHGARLPTGAENLTADYRTGIGRSGNVGSGRISLLATRPLGVKAVTNPLPATGGADRDGLDQARRNTPLGVMALDRLVSVRDHEDLARTFAGIGKAAATRLSDGRRQLVHLTIAGVDDIPIATTSDLYANLVQALHRLGDPSLPAQVAVRDLLVLVIAGQVRVAPDYRWESVSPRIRAALLEAFGFERRELGQDVLLSQVLSVIQGVEGVDYVDVDVLAAVDEGTASRAPEQPHGLADSLTLNQRIRARAANVDPAETDPAKRIRPAQLAILRPQLPETLIFTERTT